MMKYLKFTVEDFVLDKKFRKWVLAPDSETNLFWQAWLAQNPNKKPVLQEARSVLLKMPRINYGWEPQVEEFLWQSILQETQIHEQEENQGTLVPLHASALLGVDSSRKKWYRNIYFLQRIAAAVLLFILFSIIIYVVLPRRTIEKPISLLLKEAPLGSKVRFYLPDGTAVMLNAGSTLTYPDVFTNNERRVELTGEAYFEVNKNTTKPFRVKSGNLITEAVGTAFNVNCFQNQIEIALVEGKVKVSSSDPSANIQQLFLLPGEKASLQKSGLLLKESFDARKVIAWKDNILYFDGASEQEVITALEYWYGITIHTEGKASKTWNFSGKFNNKSLEYVLQSISYSMNFTFSINNDVVQIKY